MAHPYKAHAEHTHSKARVSHIMKSGDVPGYARGGKVKHHTQINIVVPKGGDAPAAGPAGPALPPPMAGPAPMMPPPGMPPGGPPPGMPMPGRKSGGRVSGGDASAKNVKGWSARASKNSYARGGGLPTAGQDSGVGRKQLTRLQKGKR